MMSNVLKDEPYIKIESNETNLSVEFKVTFIYLFCNQEHTRINKKKTRECIFLFVSHGETYSTSQIVNSISKFFSVFFLF